jgi:hypothetical protein
MISQHGNKKTIFSIAQKAFKRKNELLIKKILAYNFGLIFFSNMT